MRKITIISKISELTGIPKADISLTLEAFFQEVKTQVKERENVYVRGFGSFIAKKRAKKTGRDIRRGKPVIIPEHYIPFFIPADVFSEAVLKFYSGGGP